MDDDVITSPKDEITLFGIPASPGVAHELVFVLHEEVRSWLEVKRGSFERLSISRKLSITSEQIKEVRMGL